MNPSVGSNGMSCGHSEVRGHVQSDTRARIASGRRAAHTRQQASLGPSGDSCGVSRDLSRAVVQRGTASAAGQAGAGGRTSDANNHGDFLAWSSVDVAGHTLARCLAQVQLKIEHHKATALVPDKLRDVGGYLVRLHGSLEGHFMLKRNDTRA